MLASCWLCATLLCAACAADTVASGPTLACRLTPQPQRVEVREGVFRLRGAAVSVAVPAGPEHEACRMVLVEALRAAGAAVDVRHAGRESGNRFTLAAGCNAPPLSAKRNTEEAYSLAVGPKGATAVAASPGGLLYAAQTLRQLARLFAETGELPAASIFDYPEFKIRGIYIEGGQERFGRIVDGDYLREQIRVMQHELAQHSAMCRTGLL